MTSVHRIWNGTQLEARELAAAIRHNCNDKGAKCGACELIRNCDQAELDTLLFFRRIRERLLRSEGLL